MSQTDGSSKRGKLSSCDACRAKRQRCNRQSLNVACSHCASKGMPCTSEHLKHVRTYGRYASKRKANPGPSPNISSTASDTPEAGPSRRSLSYSSTTVQTSPAEVQAAISHLGRPLLDAFATSYSHLFYLFPNWSELYAGFALSSFDALAIEDTETAVLCLCMQALGARVISHPLVTGDAPAAKELASMSTARLLDYGRRREHICSVLRERVYSLFYSRRLATRANNQTVSIILLMMMMNGWEMDARMDRRLLAATALEMLRIMVEGESGHDARNAATQGVFIIFLLADARIAAAFGRQLQCTVQDIELFLPSILQSDTDMFSLNLHDKTVVEARAGQLLMGGIVRVGRLISEFSFSLRHNLNADLFALVWQHLDENLALQRFLKLRFGIDSDMLRWFLPAWRCEMGILAHRVLVKTIHQPSQPDVLQPQAEPFPPMADSLRQVETQSCIKFLEHLTPLLEVLQTEPPTEDFIGLLLMQSLHAVLEMTFELSAVQEGGHFPDWTLKAKVQAARILFGKFKLGGWSWMAHEPAILKSEARLEELSAMEIAIATASTPPLLFPPSGDQTAFPWPASTSSFTFENALATDASTFDWLGYISGDPASFESLWHLDGGLPVVS